jgi:hypothetical protein
MTEKGTQVLYRPVGLEELRLVFASGMMAFPPRLPEQPIFYPVLSAGYAAEIAREWNTRRDALAGYVTRFAVNESFVDQFPIHTVGAREHQELWVPAGRVADFNAALAGPVEVIDAFFGEGFHGLGPERYGLKGMDALAQLAALGAIFDYSLMDFHGELAANREAVYLHFPFWKTRSGTVDRGAEVLAAVRKAWPGISPTVPLPDF